MNLAEITPLILTKDEEVNLGRTLGQLTWANEVVVVDSNYGVRITDVSSRRERIQSIF